MTEVFISADNMVTPLGYTTAENIQKISQDITGIKTYSKEEVSPIPFCASLLDVPSLEENFNTLGQTGNYTKLEKMLILSIHDALQKSNIDIRSKKTLLIISTTKGNIDLLEPGIGEKFEKERVYLGTMAKAIQTFFGNPNQPVVVSNACISGVLAIVMGARILQSSRYENVVVAGGDIISAFTVSGFQSFKALSMKPCKPFDASRDGLNLGEGCGTILLSSNPNMATEGDKIVVAGGASSNDANHISGPSRTGDGLFIAIKNAINEARLNATKDIDYISAHGTATPYNDEMESKAFALAGLEHVPVNSFKGFFGHTLGGAGLIESIAGIHSLKKNILFNTLGYQNLGVSKNIHIIHTTQPGNLNNYLKTASGFGGCNGAVVFSKK